MRLNYLEMPVLGRIAFGSNIQGYVNAGPSVGYWLGGTTQSIQVNNGDVSTGRARIKFVDEYSRTSTNGEILKEEANCVEIGAVVGGGVKINTIMEDVLLDLRYQRGFNSTQKVEDGIKLKNNVLLVSVIYLFLAQ